MSDTFRIKVTATARIVHKVALTGEVLGGIVRTNQRALLQHQGLSLPIKIVELTWGRQFVDEAPQGASIGIVVSSKDLGPVPMGLGMGNGRVRTILRSSPTLGLGGRSGADPCCPAAPPPRSNTDIPSTRRQGVGECKR